MTQDSAAFFTLDRGTVSTDAALIAPVDGRYRMLAAASAPAGIDPGSILEDLAWRVARTDASLAGSMEGWREWSRLEVGTRRPPRVVLVAASATTGELLERAFVGAGWNVVARFFEPVPDLIALGEACLDLSLDAVAVGGREAVDEAERDRARLLWPRAGALSRLRDDLAVIACGPFLDRPEGIPDSRLFSLPQPEAEPLTVETPLRLAALEVGAHLVGTGQRPLTDARTAMRVAVTSLATVRGARVESVEIGAAASSRTLAEPDVEMAHAVMAAAGLLPRAILDEEDAAEAVLRWSTLAGDPAGHVDRLRELVLRPWSEVGRDGLHLRMAALRAAIERMESAWVVPEGRALGPAHGSTALLVLSGGAFAGLPPGAITLAIVDGIRRPGAAGILHDHAGVLAPLGALPVEADRQRLLADIMDDCLLPLGSTLMTGALGTSGSSGGTLGVSTVLGDQELALETGQLRLVDLPPGIGAQLELQADGSALGHEATHLRLGVDGGLAGLLVDTRDIPLVLPTSPEQRRAQLETWEAPAWVGADR